MRIGLGQINPVVGDLPGNAGKILEYTRRARENAADMIVFPELSLTGYPPLDLLENGAFLSDVEKEIDRLTRELPPEIGVVVGAPVRNTAPAGKRLFNAALFLTGGSVYGRVHKALLPTYDVYDEYRYFEPDPARRCIEWMGIRLGVHLCEDMWNMEEGAAYRMYGRNPLQELVDDGAKILINLSATPFATGKHEHRGRVVGDVCRHFQMPLVMVNQVGANGELVFDGRSRVHASGGEMILCGPAFEEALLIWDSSANDVPVLESADDLQDVHDALVLGIRDYVEKTAAFKKVVLGLSGGIDSAVTCALAVEALGAARVVGVAMPSPHSSAGSLHDAQALAANLGIELLEIPIVESMEVFGDLLAGVFSGTESGIAEENIQARIRGVVLMALSNKFDYLVLSTGNKSESAMGYATLYGDMAGGLAPLGDVLKTQVYALAGLINRRSAIIPESTIEKAPSAELRPGQLDQDSLPPYDVLDRILKLYVEEGREADEITERLNLEAIAVRDVLNRVDANEFKRRQAPPILRVSPKAFGPGRRRPLVCGWRRAGSTFEVRRSKKPQ